jgi:beta-lactamase regulating signal transducer with metallopeptidase domain
MNRAAGTGLMAFSVVLIVLGAILDFAISVDTSGFNINTIGLILLIVGIALFVISAAILLTASNRRSVMREDVHNTPSGSSRVVEERDNLSA